MRAHQVRDIREHFETPDSIDNTIYIRAAQPRVPQWSLSTIYRGMADYMVIQIVCLLAIIMWPQIALWLPNALK